MGLYSFYDHGCKMKIEEIRHHLDMAKRTAERSKAVRLKVGAVIVNHEGDVMTFGYNGTPKGWSNVCEDLVDGQLVTRPDVIHAEANALGKFIRSGVSTKGATMYLTHAPCNECAKTMFLSGITHVYYCEEYRSTAGVDFLRKANVTVERVSP